MTDRSAGELRRELAGASRATRAVDQHGNPVPTEAEYARCEKRRAAWITFAAAAVEGIAAAEYAGPVDETANEVA